MSVGESLRPMGKSLMEMFDTFTGRKNTKVLFNSLKEMAKGMKDLTEETEKTNELIENETTQIVEAINGLGVKTAMESNGIQGGLDQLIGSMVRMTELSDTQSWLLEELKNTNVENATTTKQGWEDMAAALQLLGETGINNEEVMENLKKLDTSIRDEKILNAIRGIQDGLEEDRLNDQGDDPRGNPNDAPKEEKKKGFLDNIISSIFGMGGKGLGGIAKLAGGLLKKLGPWVMAISAIFDFVEGFNNAADIVGKAEKDLDMFDKITAGLANVISGLTFGLVDPKAIYKWFSENMKDMFVNVIGGVLSFFTGDKEVAHEIAGDAYDFMITGLRQHINEFAANFTELASTVWEQFKDVMGELPLKLHEWIMWGWETFTSILSISSFDDAFKVVERVKDGLLSIFSPDGFLGKVLTLIENVLELVTGGVSGVAIKGLKQLGSVVQEGAAGAWDSAKNWVRGEDEKVSTRIQPQYVRRVDAAPTSQALDASKKRYEETMAMGQGQFNPNIIVKTPPAPAPVVQPSQRRRQNNFGLDLANSGAYD